jgi:hypothetical protein
MVDWPAMRERAHKIAQNTFGQAVTYHPQAGPSFATRGVFLDEHTEHDETGHAGLSTVAPTLDVQLSEMTALPKIDDELVLVDSGQRYLVLDVLPDGQGGARLMLQETP